MIRTKTIQPVPRKRVRRTEEQLISDLQLELERLKTRAATRAAKKNPSIKHTSNAVRSIDLALEDAESNTQREALNEARTLLVSFLQLEGVKIPQKRGPKPGARRSREAAARDAEE